MYIALILMLAGVAAGRLLAKRLNGAIVSRAIFIAILLLLFALGAQIGANDALFANLPALGGRAASIAFFCVAGSAIAARLIAPRLRATKNRPDKSGKPDAR